MDSVDVVERGTVVKGGREFQTEQGSVYTPGISAQTVGSRMVFLGIVRLPPGGRTRAHVHDRHESAFYLLEGDDVELWTGPALEHKSTAHAGDFLFIPAGVAHVAVKRHPTRTAVFVGVRNDSQANESVTMLPELDDRVP